MRRHSTKRCVIALCNNRYGNKTASIGIILWICSPKETGWSFFLLCVSSWYLFGIIESCIPSVRFGLNSHLRHASFEVFLHLEVALFLCVASAIHPTYHPKPSQTPAQQNKNSVLKKTHFFSGFLIGEEKKEHWNWVGVLFCGRAM